MLIAEYKPCRIHNLFLDMDGEIEITTTVSAFRLKGIGRTIWLMLDGNHTIQMIVDYLCNEFSTGEKDKMQDELLSILDMLQKRNAIVLNWDPIYKFQLYSGGE